MRKLFEEMHKDRQAGGARPARADEQTIGRQRPETGGQFPGILGPGMESKMTEAARDKDVSLVWIIDENEKLKPVFIKTGVTDNSYTEVVWGNLKEGQQAITGVWSEKESSEDRDSVRGMMMMGPPPRR